MRNPTNQPPSLLCEVHTAGIGVQVSEARFCIGEECMHRKVAVMSCFVAVASACSGRQEATPAATPSAAEAPFPETTSPYDALPEAVRLVVDKPFTGDFDEMVKRRAIRVGVTFNRTHYFIDKGQEHGLTYESLKLFEDDLNADLKTGNLKVHVVMVPMPRDQLYPALWPAARSTWSRPW